MSPFVPYGGGGIGVVRYQETSRVFAETGDDVDERFTSYHVLGGLDVPIWRRLGVGVDGHYRWVPDGLGSGGVSQEFNETNLGGATFRGRVGFSILSARRPFARRVLTVVRSIPPGRVATYGDVATIAGRPRAARAVGHRHANVQRSGRALPPRDCGWRRARRIRREILT